MRLDHRVVSEDCAGILEAPLPWDRLDGRDILVTGATGMIGGYCAAVLIGLSRTRRGGPRVRLLVRDASRAESIFGKDLDGDRVAIVEGVVESPPAFERPPDLIINAASPASPRQFAADPVAVITANALGTHAMLDAYGRGGSLSFLQVSSPDVYGASPCAQGAIHEECFGPVPTLVVRNCYAESKRLAETLLACWQARYGLHYKVVRPFHTFGPGMRLDDGRVFADFIRSALLGQPIEMTSDGTARRTFCYVADAVLGMFHVLLLGIDGEAYNVGNAENELSVREFALLAAALPKGDPLKVSFAGSPTSDYLPSSVQRGHPDVSKLEALGWKPKHGVASALRRTYETFL